MPIKPNDRMKKVLSNTDDGTLVGKLNEEELATSFDILFSKKMKIGEAAQILLETYNLRLGISAEKKVYNDRHAGIDEDTDFTPRITISPLGSLYYGQSDNFLVHCDGSEDSREVIRTFRDQLEKKYA